MSNKASGAAAYLTYSHAVGGTTFDGRPLPTFQELGSAKQAAWQQVAERAGTQLSIGQRVKHRLAGEGTIKHITISEEQRVFVWIESKDSTGRPFDHGANIGEYEAIETEAQPA